MAVILGILFTSGNFARNPVIKILCNQILSIDKVAVIRSFLMTGTFFKSICYVYVYFLLKGHTNSELNLAKWLAWFYCKARLQNKLFSTLKFCQEKLFSQVKRVQILVSKQIFSCSVHFAEGFCSSKFIQSSSGELKWILL